MTDDPRDALTRAITAWDHAMLANDADTIGAFMADDWVIVGPDGSVGGKERFLGLVRSGALTHDVMESHDMDIRLYGDTAVVVGRGISGGAYDGERFHLEERVSSVFRRDGAAWVCVLTHLSLLTRKD